MTTIEIVTEALDTYTKAKAKGLSPRRAHTAAMERARKLLRTVVGAWDIATAAQAMAGD